MAVPKKVRQQGEDADKLAQKHFGREEPAPGDEPAPAIVEPVVAPANPDQNKRIDPTDWQSRFNGLKSKYDQVITVTVPQLQGQVNDLTGKLTTALEEITGLQSTLLTTQKTPAPVVPYIDDSKSIEQRLLETLSEEEKEQYSPEFFAMVAKVSKLANQSQVTDDSLVRRVETIEQTQHKTAEDIFWDRVNSDVPNWREIQASPEFNTWLFTHDPVLGSDRNTAIVDAQQKLNADRVIGLFNQYTQGLSQLAQMDDQNSDPRLRHLVPDDAGAGDVDLPNDQKPIFKLSTVNKFYKDRAMGKYRGKEAQAVALEKQYEEADREGRIVQG